MCDMAHSYMWHDLFICVTRLMYTCDMTRSYVHMCLCVMTHSWVRYSTIHMCDSTYTHTTPSHKEHMPWARRPHNKGLRLISEVMRQSSSSENTVTPYGLYTDSFMCCSVCIVCCSVCIVCCSVCVVCCSVCIVCCSVCIVCCSVCILTHSCNDQYKILQHTIQTLQHTI